MRFKVRADVLPDYRLVVRRSGYATIYDRRRGVESFVRRLGGGHYPRFHMYIDDLGEEIVFNLHLDQKKASYKGFNMHNAEYDNDLVKEEAMRIKSMIGVDSGDRHSNKKISRKTEDKRTKPVFDENKLNGDLESDILRINNKKKKNKFWFFKL
jgi:hypothetical protein